MKSNYIVRGGYDASGITKGLAQTQKQLAGFQAQTSKSMSAISGGMKLALGYISVRAIAGFVKATTKLASDLTEVQNVVDVTFGSMANEVNEFAKTSITSFGLSELAAKKYTSTMGAMLKSSGLSGKAAKDMSIDLVKLSADMASFYNLSNDEAFEKIQSGMAGMSRPLRDLGINMNIVNLNAYALSQGIKKTYKQMSQSEQEILRYNYLMSVTGDAQGDFARTSMTWANQTKILGEQFKMLGATIGGGFINMLTPLLSVINSIIAKLQVAVEYFKAFTALIFGDGNQGSGGTVSNVADITEDATNNMDELGNAGSKAAKKIKGAFAGLDEITTLGSKDGGSGGGSGVTGGASPVNLGALTKGEFKIDENITKVFDDIKRAADPTLAAIKNLWDNGLSKFATFTWTALKDFYKDFLLPIGKWILGKDGIPKLVTAFNDLLTAINWDKLNGSLKTLWTALSPFAIAVGTGLVDFIADLSKELSPVIGATLDVLSEALLLFADAISSISPNTLRDLGKSLGVFFVSLSIVKTFGKVATMLTTVGTGLKNFAQGASLLSSANLTTLSIVFGGLVSDLDEWVTTTIGEKFGKIWENIFIILGNAGFGALTGFTFGSLPGAIIGALIGGLIAVVTTLDLSSVWNTLMKGLKSSLALVFNFSKTQELFSGMIENFAKALNGKNILEIGGNIVQGIFDGIGAALALLLEPIFDLFNGIITGVKKLFGIKSPSTVFAEIGKYLVEGLKKGITDAWINFTTFITGLPGKIVSAFGNIKTLFQTKGADILSGIKKGWTDGWTNFNTWLRGLPQKIANAIGSLVSVGKDLMNGLIQGIKSVSIPTIQIPVSGSYQAPSSTTGSGKLTAEQNAKIRGYATGGFPSAGELFVGNENGIEMMGRMGNQNVVANNNQITEGIKQAVVEAMLISGGNQKDTGITQLNLIVDSEVLATAVDKGRANKGRRTDPTLSFI